MVLRDKLLDGAVIVLSVVCLMSVVYRSSDEKLH